MAAVPGHVPGWLASYRDTTSICVCLSTQLYADNNVCVRMRACALARQSDNNNDMPRPLARMCPPHSLALIHMPLLMPLPTHSCCCPRIRALAHTLLLMRCQATTMVTTQRRQRHTHSSVTVNIFCDLLFFSLTHWVMCSHCNGKRCASDCPEWH